MSNFVESEFYNRKVDVFDATLKPFNSFYNNDISEVSNYQGYLDSIHASNYSEKVLRKNPFIDEVVFYDVFGGEAGRIIIYAQAFGRNSCGFGGGNIGGDIL